MFTPRYGLDLVLQFLFFMQPSKHHRHFVPMLSSKFNTQSKTQLCPSSALSQQPNSQRAIFAFQSLALLPDYFYQKDERARPGDLQSSYLFSVPSVIIIIIIIINVPKSVETSQGGKVTILWNQQVQTDRTIPSNKPDIIIRDNEKGTCMLIDVAISGDRNVIKKEAEKVLKYTELTIEIQRTECKKQR